MNKILENFSGSKKWNRNFRSQKWDRNRKFRKFSHIRPATFFLKVYYVKCDFCLPGAKFYSLIVPENFLQHCKVRVSIQCLDGAPWSLLKACHLVVKFFKMSKNWIGKIFFTKGFHWINRKLPGYWRFFPTRTVDQNFENEAQKSKFWLRYKIRQNRRKIDDFCKFKGGTLRMRKNRRFYLRNREQNPRKFFRLEKVKS